MGPFTPTRSPPKSQKFAIAIGPTNRPLTGARCVTGRGFALCSVDAKLYLAHCYHLSRFHTCVEGLNSPKIVEAASAAFVATVHPKISINVNPASSIGSASGHIACRKAIYIVGATTADPRPSRCRGVEFPKVVYSASKEPEVSAAINPTDRPCTCAGCVVIEGTPAYRRRWLHPACCYRLSKSTFACRIKLPEIIEDAATVLDVFIASKEPEITAVVSPTKRPVSRRRLICRGCHAKRAVRAR